MLRKVFEPRSEEFRGELRKFLHEELRCLNSLSNTITVIIFEMMREEKCIKSFGE